MSSTQPTDSVWIDLLWEIADSGSQVGPRGKGTLEILAKTTVVDMKMPVVTIPQRNLGYKFMAAEAHWILSGDNRVETIEPYSKQISSFSDDGVRFFGAYGPKVVDQLSYVVDCLIRDEASRQAVMTIWRERPGSTKDLPCTVALQFMIRDGKLNCHATMRSSDAWLGWVYDVFNFSMVAWTVLEQLRMNEQYSNLQVGSLFLTAASQHLYDSDRDAYESLFESWRSGDWALTLAQYLENYSGVNQNVLQCLDTMRRVGVDEVLS